MKINKSRKQIRDGERKMQEKAEKLEKEVQALIDSTMANGGSFDEWMRQQNEADAVNRC